MNLDELYERHGESLYRYLLFKLGSAEDAEDVLQEAFCRFARCDLRWTLVRNERAFVFRVARNEARRFLGRKLGRREGERMMASAGIGGMAAVFSTPDEPGLAILLERTGDLPAEQREAVYLKVFDGLTFREIASVCGVSANTAASRYRYAIAKLREAVCRDRLVDDQALLGIIGDLEPEPWRERQARAIRGERTFFIETGLKGLSDARADLSAFWGDLKPLQRVGVWLIRPLLKWDMRTALPRFIEAEALARRPYYETRASLRERERKIAERPWYAYFSKLLMGNLEAAFMKEAQLEATLLAARTGLACRLYKSRTGSYPESLGALVPGILKDVPVDPFTGRPLVYRRDGEGFIVYSLGSNQKDDGGRSTYMITQLVMEKDDDVPWRETR